MIKDINTPSISQKHPYQQDMLPCRLHTGWDLPPASHDTEHEEETDVLVAEPELKKPPMYAVVFYNDDYTPMEFVVEILQSMFGHSLERATEVMLNVHYQGKGIAGIYPRDIAETKAQMVSKEARLAGHPLMCEIEPV